MGTKTLLSLEEFEHLPDDGMRHELNKGELVVMPFPKSAHIRTAKRIEALLSRHITHDIGYVYVEAGYQLSARPATMRQPDVSFISAVRVAQTADDSYFQGAPDLAVEIVSPGNSAADLEEKVQQYLAAGARVVWVVYPKLRRAHVYRPDGTIANLGPDQQLSAEDILPGLTIPVSALFE